MASTAGEVASRSARSLGCDSRLVERGGTGLDLQSAREQQKRPQGKHAQYRKNPSGGPSCGPHGKGNGDGACQEQADKPYFGHVDRSDGGITKEPNRRETHQEGEEDCLPPRSGQQ